MKKTKFERLSLLQQKLVIPKAKYNAHGKYKYRSMEDVLESAKRTIKENSLDFVIQVSDTVEQVGDRFYIKATAKILDSETGDLVIENTAFAREANEQKGMNLAQLTGSTSSYARKYALCGLLAIDDNKDLDSTENKVESKPLSPEQIMEIQSLIDCSTKTVQEVCQLMKVDSLADLPQEKIQGLKRSLINYKK